MVARSPKSCFAVTTALTLGFLAIFLVPLHIPMSPGISDAYLTGFNGHAGLSILGVVLFGVAFWTGGLGLALPKHSGTRVVGKPVLYQTVVVTTVCVLGIWWLMRPSIPANEAHYFADRYLMYQSGARLYAEMEFPYGPLMFYLPVWIKHLTSLSMTDSYFASWAMQWLVGVWMLWLVVDLTTPNVKHAKSIYLLLWGFSLVAVSSAGPNYTPFRFASAPLAALLVYRSSLRHKSMFPALTLACLGFLVILFYSPEQGIAFGLATVVFFLLNAPRREGFIGGAILYLALSIAGLVLAEQIGLLNSIKQFGGGGFAFPFVLSGQNVLLLLLLQAAVCGVWGTLRQNSFDHPLFYLCLVAGALTLSAFGRSDSGHIVFNLLGAFLTGFIVLTPYPALWRWAKYSFLLVIVILGAGLSLYNGRGLVLNAMGQKIAHEGRHGGLVRRLYFFGIKNARGEQKARRALDELDVKAELDAHAVLAQDNGTPLRLLAPFGHVASSFDLRPGPRISSGRYAFLFPLLSADVAQEKIQELDRQTSAPLLLPDKNPLSCMYDETAERQMLQSVLTPIYLPAFTHRVSVAEPLCDYIGTHYHRSTIASPEIGYQIWERSR